MIEQNKQEWLSKTWTLDGKMEAQYKIPALLWKQIWVCLHAKSKCFHTGFAIGSVKIHIQKGWMETQSLPPDNFAAPS